jgi:hypothetical protein
MVRRLPLLAHRVEGAPPPDRRDWGTSGSDQGSFDPALWSLSLISKPHVEGHETILLKKMERPLIE